MRVSRWLKRSHNKRLRVLAGLKHDHAFWAAFALFATALAPYLLPGLTTEQRQIWGSEYADVPVTAAILLTLDPAPGRGATFVAYFPAVKAVVESPAIPAVNVSHSGRVLLVDDDQAVAAVAEALLKKIGFEVTTLFDSREALMTLQSDPHRFDLLFTDHTMPDITGPDLAEAAYRLNPDIAIVISSGFRLGDSPLASADFEQLGKPFNEADIEAAVERVHVRA